MSAEVRAGLAIAWKPNFLHFSQDRDRLAQITQRFQYRSVFSLNFFRNRKVALVAVEK